MKWMIQGLAAGMALAAAGVAGASTNTVSDPGGGLTMSFSADWLGTLDTIRATVASYGGGSANVMKDTDGYFTQITAAAYATTLTMDTDTHQALSLSTSGGFTVNTPLLKSVSSGGSLTVTDLSVDFTNKTVYGTLIGGNGVGSVAHMALWQYANLTGSTAVNPSAVLCDDWWSPTTGWGCAHPYGSMGNFNISGLMITADGRAKFAQALGMDRLGWAALNGIDDYGQIVSGVPEASTSALMGLGLLGMALKFGRRIK
jgi:hypothetical protein